MSSVFPLRRSDDIFITRREASERLRVSLSTIDRYVAAGELERLKIGPRRTLFRLRDVERLVRRDGSASFAMQTTLSNVWS
ncbi:AlpA family transcriptional regulator [Gluconobacter sp. DsW_058]|uniref:helix-turn-helix transcriptional regulator n=1 Tax=Gluconobacter sp. DsW_058 TaxID=1511210 RepID=UPI000A38B8A8|nr:helix-turn-helix domain-containing protein [Gluconobacter sp. DsW_058]